MCFMLACNGRKPKDKIEPNEKAVILLQKTGEAVQSSHKKSFTLIVDEEKLDPNEKKYHIHNEYHIKTAFPGKIFVDGKRNGENYQMYYDGLYFTYYSKDENNYITLNAPPTSAELIDSLHHTYGFKFPAGDFFYPSFAEDIKDNFKNIDIVGTETIESEPCTEIHFQNTDYDVNISVSDKTSLPKKFTIIYKNEKDVAYKATFKDWNLTTAFSDSVFHFVAPENSRLIDIVSKN